VLPAAQGVAVGSPGAAGAGVVEAVEAAEASGKGPGNRLIGVEIT